MRTLNRGTRTPILTDMPQVGDIVLAVFPFTGRSCVVLALTESPGDFVFAFITSGSLGKFPRFGIAIDSTHPSWRQTRLKAPSVVRTDKLCTLNTRVISGRLGVFPPDLLNAIRARLKILFSI
jgi:hypothetical protein